MEKLTNLISKKVYSLTSGNCLGYVLNVALSDNLGEISSLVIVDDESEIEGKIASNNFSIKGDYVFVPGSDKISYGYEGSENNLIGKEVFSNKGDSFGRVIDVIFSSKKIQNIIAEKAAFLPKQVSLCGNDAIIIGGKKNLSKAKAASFDQQIKQPEQLVTISSNSALQKPAVPYRISTDPKNLIGKMATKDIFGLNNELIIKKFEIITQKKLNEAKKHNKLNILFYNCK